MNTQNLLTGLLVVQLGLAGITWWPRGSAPPEPRAVVPFAMDAITGLSIESTSTRARGKALSLEKRGDGWVLASEHGYPVDAAKVQETLDKLTGIRVRRPLATQATSHDALNVSVDKATRFLKVSAGDQQVELYLGTASHGKSYLRVAGEDDVWEVSGFGAWSVSDMGTGYYDTKWLDVDPATLDSWTLTNALGTVALTRTPEGVWTADGLPEGAVLPQEAVQKLFRDTLSLTMSGPADPAQGDPLTRDGALEVSWTVDGGDGGTTLGSYRGFIVNETLLVKKPGDAFAVGITAITPQDALSKTTLETLLAADE